MSSEHQLISLLEGCLTCAPQLSNMPIGAKVRKAVEQFNQAQALGFDSTEAMREHQEWLKRNGTPEYKQWLASVMPAQVSETQTGEQHG